MESLEEFFSELQKFPITEQLQAVTLKCKNSDYPVWQSSHYGKWLIHIIDTHGVDYIKEKLQEITLTSGDKT